MSSNNNRQIRELPVTSNPNKPRGLWWGVKRGLFCFALLLLILIALNFRLMPGKNRPLVQVSPQTTWATSPLKPNGDVDYIGFLNQQNAVPPEQNAFVDLIRIIGPEPEGTMLRREFFRLLGIEPLPADGDYLKSIPLRDRPNQPALDLSVTMEGVLLDNEQVFDVTMSVPFGPDEFPAIDQWLYDHEHHLLAIRQAVRKPGYFAPYVGDTVIGVLLPHVQQMRDVARTLSRSSMQRIGKGDIAGAIDDQLAILRLGRLSGQKGTLVELLVGTAIEGIGHQAIAQTIFSGKCTKADLARLADEMGFLPELPMINRLHIQSERVMALDAAIFVGRTGKWSELVGLAPASQGASKNSDVANQLWLASIDWETVLKTLNKSYDEIELLVEIEGVSERVAAHWEYELSQKAKAMHNSSPVQKIRSVVGGRASRGRMKGEELALFMNPALKQISEAGDRIKAQNVVTQVAIALERFRIVHGEYPETLGQLVPQFLDALPSDPFSQQPLVYRLDKDGSFQLYSIGPNRKDDGGIALDEGPYPDVDLTAEPTIRNVKDWIERNKKE